jgi:hypothetical protein
MEPSFRDDDDLPPLRSTSSAPKTIGILNIIFAALLLLCGVCSGMNIMMQSAMGPMMAMHQQQFQQALEAERQEQIQRLQAQEQAAQDEQEKADLRAQQERLKAQPLPRMPNIMGFMQDPLVQGYYIVDIFSGLLLNALLLISGIGLVGMKEWGRVTALWTAGLKIVRLVVLYGFFAVVGVPVIVQQFTAMFRQMLDEFGRMAPPGQKMPGPNELAQMGTGMGIMMTASAVAIIIFGVIYPVIMLIVLTRPNVKAACAVPVRPG